MNRNPHQGVLCADCKKRMFSYSGHDYLTCGCPNDTMVDGGKNYLRYGWITNPPQIIDYEEALDGKPKTN